MRVEFEDVLWAKVTKHAEMKGYASPEKFVQDTMQMQIGNASWPEEDQSVIERLQGLGYLDFGRDI